MSIQEVVCLEVLLSSQSEQFKTFQKAVIGWKKSGPSKKVTLFLGM